MLLMTPVFDSFFVDGGGIIHCMQKLDNMPSGGEEEGLPGRFGLTDFRAMAIC